MKRKLLVVSGSVLAVLIIAVICMSLGLSEGAKVNLTGIDISNLADGNYIGNYASGRWTNTVSAQVKDGKIISIDIIDDVFGAQVTNCSGEVIRRVIEAQNTTVDAVSGATVTSKAYLKAIEDALNP